MMYGSSTETPYPVFDEVYGLGDNPVIPIDAYRNLIYDDILMLPNSLSSLFGVQYALDGSIANICAMQVVMSEDGPVYCYASGMYTKPNKYTLQVRRDMTSELFNERMDINFGFETFEENLDQSSRVLTPKQMINKYGIGQPRYHVLPFCVWGRTNCHTASDVYHSLKYPWLSPVAADSGTLDIKPSHIEVGHMPEYDQKFQIRTFSRFVSAYKFKHPKDMGLLACAMLYAKHLTKADDDPAKILLIDMPEYSEEK